MWASELKQIKESRHNTDTKIGTQKGEEISNEIITFLTEHKVLILKMLTNKTDIYLEDINRKLSPDDIFDLVVQKHSSTIDNIATTIASRNVTNALGVNCYVSYDLCSRVPYDERSVIFTLTLR